MVAPTNSPLTTLGRQFRSQPEPPPAPAPVISPPVHVHQPELEMWLQKFQIARDNFEARRYSTALSVFREIADQAPDALLQVRSVYWMGETYFGMKRYRDAREQFERVLSLTDINSLRTPAMTMIKKCNNFLR